MLWWVASGEVVWDPTSAPDVPAAVVAALPATSVGTTDP